MRQLKNANFEADSEVLAVDLGLALEPGAQVAVGVLTTDELHIASTTT